MSVRSRAGGGTVEVAKVFGSSVPPQIAAAEEASQMTPASPFGPGAPIGPYDGYSRTPRAREFVTGYNIATRPRTHERVSFETLKGLIESYDVAQIVIRHRISSLRSLDWKLIPGDGYEGDVSREIAEGKRVLKRPDGRTLFKGWLAKYLRDVLSYDAGTLYRMRNRAGRAVGLKVVSGIQIAPLLDYWGDSPEAPAPAFVQYVNGLPWNWLTRDDLIYEPYDPQPDSIYGRAPLEDILLNANTDIRFQLYFLQRFTAGNLPAAFASAPDTWSPTQIEQFQEYWDGFMLGNQEGKHQIRWLPPGSKIAWSNEKDFDDRFSLFLMRKTCASYSVVPSDLGFTEDVNRSSGESQADVQHRVGDLPLAHHIQDILSAFLQDDLQLPLRFAFDLGEEQDDRLNQAQADEIYIRNAVIGSSEVREMRFGLPEPDGQMVPRGFFTERSGLIPLNSVLAVAGPIDPATGAPEPGAPLPHMVFGGVEGVLPNPPIKIPSLAEQEYGPSAMPPAPPPQPKMTDADVTPELLPAPVAKEGEGGAPAAGITADTGLYSYDLVRALDDDEDSDAASVAKEMSAFRRFEKARRKAGEWRDFEFRAIGRTRGHNLNDAGRLAVRKASGEVAVAGLAVLAADTGRVLMLQRALVDDDPAAGTWEFPGGHLEGAESPLAAAWREWQEETGAACAPGVQTGSWTSGIYQGIVWTIEREAMIPVRSDTVITNPDDPDSDQVEAIAWWNPETLPGNPAVRAELLACIGDVMAALGLGGDSACCGAECCSGGCCGGAGGCQCEPPCEPDPPAGEGPGEAAVAAAVEKRRAELAEIDCLMRTPPSPGGAARARHRTGSDDHLEMGVAKAGGRGPKAPDGRTWPGWKLDERTAAHWAPEVRDAVTAALPPAWAREMGRDYLADHPEQQGDDPGKRDRNKAAAAWLAAWLAGKGITPVPAAMAEGIATDGYLIGAASASAATSGQGDADTGGWEPGDQDKARQRLEELGLLALLLLALGGGGGASAAEEAGTGLAAETAADAITSGYLGSLAIILAGTDADWADSQETLDELGGMLSAALADEGLATTLVGTQISIFTGLAAQAYYMANSVAWGTWITAGDTHVCERCLANANAGPVRMGQPYPSGHAMPPVHPGGCAGRCAVIPADMAGLPGLPGLPSGLGDEEAAAGEAGTEDAEAAEGAAEGGTGEPGEAEPGAGDAEAEADGAAEAEGAPPEFMDPAQARQFLIDNQPDLAEEQLQAVEWYSGGGYSAANAQLRDGEGLTEYVAEKVAALDSAMAPLPQDVLLARAVEMDAFPDGLPAAGDVISDPAFQSTSAERPDWWAGWTGGVMMSITAPEGTPAVLIGELSANPGEREVLLARGTQLIVESVEQTPSGSWELSVKVVPQVAKAAAPGAAQDGQPEGAGGMSTLADRMADARYQVVSRPS